MRESLAGEMRVGEVIVSVVEPMVAELVMSPEETSAARTGEDMREKKTRRRWMKTRFMTDVQVGRVLVSDERFLFLGELGDVCFYDVEF